MKTRFPLFPGAICFVLTILQAAAAPSIAQPPDVSFRHEVQLTIDRGLDWLKTSQNTNGYWSTPDQPALTALALTAFMGDPSGDYQAHPTPGIEHGYQFVTSCAKPDGSIYNKGLQNYNTAICMMGLVAARNSQYNPLLHRGRQWLVSQQVRHNEDGKGDSPYDGGVGYGDHGPYSDMNNTFTALEALYYTKYIDADKPSSGKDLDWAAAIHFIQSCQNLPAYDKQSWVSTDPKDAGGFFYKPGESKRGSFTNAEGRVALRSYGSISYAGILSYIYADLKRDDPRVQAAFDWLRHNYTVDENPGMGAQGLYYYLQMMTKALTIYGVDQLPVSASRSVDWRREAAMKLINLQKADGSWQNDNGRWLEHDPALVTAYSLMSLEMLYPKL